MLRSNGHYGHREILNAYAGVAAGTPLPGHLQHGWNYDLGSSVEGVLLSAPNPFFLWSDRNLRNCRKAGLAGHVTAVGAPFLYLPEPAPSPPPEPGSLLVMPFHGWEKERIEQDFSEYAQAIREISGEFRKITVCLYWFDNQFPEYRRPFEELGAEVLTIGPRDDNPRFLHDTVRLMSRCEYVTANRVQTAAFYALALGRKFFVYGPPVGLDKSLDRSGELFHAWQKQEFPQLFWESFGDRCHRVTGEDELGLAHKRSPEALRELLLWQPAQRAERERRIAAYHAALEQKRKDAAWQRLRERALRFVPAALRARLARGA